ncbi:protein-glutamate methylesterase/protein-glutamine glutaminase [Vibrio sonorensis]|uniref:protein-glutamate methylesterase/protein-glutamine glutaminase n=1 Tax=Vibrio sonorensis TaxID=1004316 RepID=UPI0008DAD0AF|nr:chemotaxis response regulator protein-glutamate methylesterase [Vibrio sonorensis]
MKPINVFIVDDSAVIRQVLGEMLEKDPGIHVCGTAPDPILARRKMEKHWPDVVLLDIVMPKMDGIAFLKEIMSTRPTPTIIISQMTEQDPALSLEALSSGAIEVINKPQSQLSDYLQSPEARQIISSIKQAHQVKVKTLKYTSTDSYRQKESADVILKPQAPSQDEEASHVIVIGASTGGTDAIREFLVNTPVNSPPIVVVQHMPELFTRAFAERLNEFTKHKVVEAKNDQEIHQGHVYIAPGGVHTLLKCRNHKYYLELKDGPLVSRHKPSVDVLFRSAAQNAGNRGIGVILTGMGDDGAQGLKELHQAGAATFAQDEESSLVFGMPKEAIAKGGVGKICSLDLLPYQVQKAMVKL